MPVPLTLSTNGVDPADLAVEFTRAVPLFGNVSVGGRQFWLGPTGPAPPSRSGPAPPSCT